MKTLIQILFVLFFIPIIAIGQNRVKLKVSNPLAINSELQLVEIPLSKLDGRITLKEGQVYLVKDKSNKLIPSQVTSDNKLIFPCALKAKKSATFSITAGEAHPFPSRVFGRHYPERKGDFSWENDRVGFRFYGKELKDIQAPTGGLDLWYKRTDKLVLDNWYSDELSGKASYHVDHGEGCDPYAVGQSLGAGCMAVFVDSILHMNENFDSFEILDKGSLRFTVKLTYPSITINGKEIGETRTITLDAGSQLTRIVQEYTTSELITVAAGFPKRQSGDSILHQKGRNYFVYQEPDSKDNGQIYLGILIPEGIENVFVNEKTQVGNNSTILTSLPNVVATTTYSPGKPIVYYTGFGWNKYGFENVTTFDHYMQHYSRQIAEPLIVTIK